MDSQAIQRSLTILEDRYRELRGIGEQQLKDTSTELHALTQERDALTQERDALIQERDALANEKEKAQEFIEKLNKEMQAKTSGF